MLIIYVHTCTSMTLVTFIGFSFQGSSGSKCGFSANQRKVELRKWFSNNLMTWLTIPWFFKNLSRQSSIKSSAGKVSKYSAHRQHPY